MEVTVIFRNMRPHETLVTLVKKLLEARGSTMDGRSGRLQISIRKTYAVHLSSDLSRQGWTEVDDEPERAVRTIFERFDRAAAHVRGPVEARASERVQNPDAFAAEKVGKSPGVHNPAAP
jgi:hypothetical protein